MEVTISDIYSAIPTLTEQEVKGLIDRLKGYLYREKKVDKDEDAMKSAYRGYLASFSGLSAGWDGENAEPICPEVIESLYDLIEALPYSILSQWYLVPDTNGTIGLQAKDKKKFAVFSIGKNGYAYVARSGSRSVKEEKPLRLDSLISDVNRITGFIM